MMTVKPPLHVLFTLNCEPAGVRTNAEGPKTWEASGRAIEGFCIRVGRAGYRPTLFASLPCVEEQAPLFEELSRRGAEVGLYLHPPQIGDGRFKRFLGQYNADDQRSLIDYAAERFADQLGARPRSFRGGHFSANNDTYQLLFDLGFRQGSLSEPGRALTLREAVWTDARQDPHYVDPGNRLVAGDLPFLELPITTDPTNEMARGIPYALQIEAGSVEGLHREVIERELERFEREGVAFRALVFYASTRVDFYADDDKHAQTLEVILDYLEQLASQVEIHAVTAFAAHDHYRLMVRNNSESA
jgi:hypothetical protein